MPTDTLDIWRTAAAHSRDLGTIVPEPTLGTDETEPGDIILRAYEPDGGERYLDRGLLSRGGMGEVRLVWDRRLGRLLARKILSGQISHTAWERFTAEARLTARLNHPGVVPVYDFGVLSDGRPWFTMKRVEGQTLSEVIAAAHAAPVDGGSLRRVVSALLRACEAVAYAHTEGVLHRDLKPDNIMVGAFGQVYVVDWGIARLPDPGTRLTDPADDFSPAKTRSGAVFGTPAYMAPEQAAGLLERFGPATDVYGLGATLWHVLVGRHPYAGRTGDEILRHLRTFPAPPDPSVRALPEELVALCTAAMAPHPEARLPDAAAFASAISDWLDGARRQEEAMALVHRARSLLPTIDTFRGEAAKKRAAAGSLLADTRSWDPVEKKQPAWDLEDAAEALEHRAERTEIEATQLLRSALTRSPDLAPAHQLLADRYQKLHAIALQAGDAAAALRLEALLRRHDQGQHHRWLDGLGTLSLVTDPPGCSVALQRFEERGRRMVAVATGDVLTTPIQAHTLPAGSYLAHITGPGLAGVRYPVRIPRGGQWLGIRPGETHPTPIGLPDAGALGKDDVYIPAGPAPLGNPAARNGLPRREIWVDAFVIRRHPVTNAGFLTFLNELVSQGRTEEALRWVPREHTANNRDSVRPIYHQRPDSTFFLGEDSTGDVWEAAWPVVLVTWEATRAWCAWEAERTGKPWRLPWEFEREKVAVGVDGRCYPWGDTAEPTWSRNSQSQPGRNRPVAVSATPTDVSPYGVFGLTGNCRDWCLDINRADGPPVQNGLWTRPDQPAPGNEKTWRVFRGGAWSTGITHGLIGSRLSGPWGYRRSSLGFRAAYSIEGAINPVA